MRTISAPIELIRALKPSHHSDLSIGLVPTMGALHKGHLELISRSKADNDLTVASIFVNPIQFNNSEDLKNYPRTIEKDLQLLRELAVDLVFTPSESDLYPNKPSISIHFGQMANVLEGQFRPRHFDGVGIVVSKLLNIVNPCRAYFGLKDLQQFLLIKKMCAELSFQNEIVGVETVREKTGLAMSSRNQRLSDSGKLIATSIYEGLNQIKHRISEGEELKNTLQAANDFYRKVDGLELEYVAAVDPSNFAVITSAQGLQELAVCFAGYVEGVRLIDNLYLRLKFLDDVD